MSTTATDPVAAFLGRLADVRQAGPDKWLARCPAHDDKHPSLSVARGHDGRLLVRCHAGCGFADIMQAAGLGQRQAFAEPAAGRPCRSSPAGRRAGAKAGPSPSGKHYASPDAAVRAVGRRVAGTFAGVWPYLGPDGVEVMRVARFDLAGGGKTFRPVHQAADGWRVGDPPGPLPLYRLPDLPAAGRLYVVEGEKCADAAWSVGLPATTSSHGSRSAGRTDWGPLAGRDVVVLPDADGPGRAYADDVAELLRALVPRARVLVVNLPGLPDGGDIVDYIDGFGDAADPDDVAANVDALADAAVAAVPPPPPADGPGGGNGGGTPPDEPLDRRDRTGTARRFLADRYGHRERHTLLRAQHVPFRWDGGAYREVDQEMLRSEVRLWLDARQAMAKAGGTELAVAYKPSQADVREVMAAIEDLTVVDAAQPAWLDGGAGRPDPRTLLVCRNGIVDLAAKDLPRLPVTPRLFTTNALPFDFDPTAPPPAEWLRFLATVSRGDEQFVAALQQWFGYCLTSDTSQQKILMLVGPPRSGKGTIARVLTHLVGLANCAAPTLASLGSQFGLAPLLNKRLAVVGDARLSGRSDAAVVVERLLSISGEDAVDVDRKYLPPVTCSLGARLVVLTNELPRLNDPSGAVASRFVVLMFRDSFLGREDTALTGRLLRELPGTLLWAIEGWHRLRAAGRFVQPAASQEAVDELAAVVSPIRAFVGDWCKLGPGEEVTCVDVFDGWRAWCAEQGRADAGNVQRFGADLRAAVPSVEVRRPRDGVQRVRTYAGIGLTAAAAELTRVWRAKRTEGGGR